VRAKQKQKHKKTWQKAHYN